MVIEVRVLVMNVFWWVMQFSWVSPMYMLLSSVWLSPIHLSHVNLILRDKAGWAEGNVFFPQRGMSWTCGRSACLDPPENCGAYWCAHICVHTHTEIFSEWGTPQIITPLAEASWAPPVLPQVLVFPSFPHICEAPENCLWETELCPGLSARAFQALVFRIYLKFLSPSA